MGALHAHRAHVDGLVSPTPDRVLHGRAVTIQFAPIRRDLVDPAVHEFDAMLLEAVGANPTGAVLVASSGGHPAAALAGGKKLSRLRNLGMAGMICDGSLRDMAEAAEMGLVVWARGETIRNANDLLMPIAANVPVVVDGVTVVPGDWVYADGAGVVIVPERDADAVIDAARAIEARDGEEILRLAAADAARIAPQT
jgi:4-hydroxy-4-methyl-2-oxoglutarate aldolase